MRKLMALLLILSLSGCDPEDGWFGITKPREGELTVGLAVTPVDIAEKVVLVFNGIEFQSDTGVTERFVFDAPRVIDLLSLQNSRERLLDRVSLEPGRYTGIRLLARGDQSAQESFVTLPNDTYPYPLLLPDDIIFGIEADFLMPDEGALDLTLSFDLRRGLVGSASQGSYELLPTFRLVDTESAGGISGTVNERFFSRNCSPEGRAVYVFAGSRRQVNDMYPIDDGIVLSTVVRSFAGDRNGRYEASHLPAGSYTLAFTCQADQDNPQREDENVQFFGTLLNIAVETGSVTEADFNR